MDPFRKFVDRPESSILEYKRELPKKEVLLATLSALANTAGGEIIIGSDDKGLLDWMRQES